jgi:hypothetical protein
MGHAMCKDRSSGAKSSINGTDQRDKTAERGNTIKILLVLLHLVVGECFEGRLAKVAGSKAINDSNIKVPVAATLTTGNKISAGVKIVGGASTSSSASRERAQKRFLTNRMLATLLEIELPGADDL